MGLSGLNDEVIYITEQGEFKVNLLEAVMGGASIPLVSVLYKTCFDAYPETQDQLLRLYDHLNPEIKEIFPVLLTDSPDYVALLPRFEAKSQVEPVLCHNCNQFKPPSIPQICEKHLFCSETCLSTVRSNTGINSLQCPLCTVKIPKARRIVVIQKKPTEEMEMKCRKCGETFECNVNDPWRLDKIGSSEYEKVKIYCSEPCFLSENPRKTEEIRQIPCIICGQNAGFSGKILHCEVHGLCSPSCLSRYYRGKITDHQYSDGSCICYQCLEQYLSEFGEENATPEVEILKRKLSVFKGEKAVIKGDEHSHVTGRCKCTYIDCGYYISPYIITLHTYQTLCVFCSTPIRVTKHMEAGYVLSEDMPFLISCEFRIHGVCSRGCLRGNVPNPEEPVAIRCPRCRKDSLITGEAIAMGLYKENPTIECIRRIPHIHFCDEFTPTFVLEGCRHEICVNAIDRLVGDDGLVHCPICGNTATIEEATEAQHTYQIKSLRDG